ncbi:MAG: radical SAM protein [Deltaproteobacteria bacterium]|nr:radical SAM protein [Deltaproteobacteria bacterium]
MERKTMGENQASERKYLFGPVPSRRLGLSLGIDLTPFKTCSLDCVFCQLGRTTKKTVLRKEYVPIEAVIAEIEAWLASGGRADYLTLSGSGEPTLHSRFGDVLSFIRSHCGIPTVLLTNGTMLFHPEVRSAACNADIVKVSLSAWDQASYGWMNRPHPDLRFEQLIEGQKIFRDQFKGNLWMEVFLVAGMNSSPDDVSKIAALVEEIRPDRIHLNTAVRPPAEEFAQPLSRQRLAALVNLFRPTAEVIAEFTPHTTSGIRASQERVFSMLKRRPCTAEQIAEAFGMHLNEVSKIIGNLLRAHRILAERRDTAVYYRAKNTDEKSTEGMEGG